MQVFDITHESKFRMSVYEICVYDLIEHSWHSFAYFKHKFTVSVLDNHLKFLALATRFQIIIHDSHALHDSQLFVGLCKSTCCIQE